MQEEADLLLESIEALKDSNGESWTIKQQEKQRRFIMEKLDSLRNDKIKDDVIVFATGTPISNSMAELYTMMKYLQTDLLKEFGLWHFDSWAASFGHVVESLEITPEGNSFRMRKRFSEFVNIPELITMFRQVADIIMPDSLNLNLPKLKNGKYTVIECEPNDAIKRVMDDFIIRAEACRNGKVNPSDDNMLKICNDARLLSTDIRLLLPDESNYENSKLNRCVNEVYRIYRESDSFQGTQVIFSDIGTPTGKKEFNVYDYIKGELIQKGIPESEICFIHDAKNNKDRVEMFADLRNGTKRIIIGSTSKMGTGTNIQKRLIAMHEIDVPWRPSDVEQREGRILRQGNENETVEILRYVMKGTFDQNNWFLIETKQRGISQIITGADVPRVYEDVDAVLDYAQMKAIATGNPLIKEKMELDIDISKLKTLRSLFFKNHYKLENDIKVVFPSKLKRLEESISLIQKDIAMRDTYKESQITIQGVAFEKGVDAGEAFFKQLHELKLDEKRMVGTYCNVIKLRWHIKDLYT